MQPIINPSETTFSQAKNYINLMDANKSKEQGLGSILVSKTTKNLKTVKPTVLRYFEAPNQTNNYYGMGEYDLVSPFKLLEQESYFRRATEKKIELFFKSGQSIQSDDDEITKYFSKRFMIMQMQTGVSIHNILRQLVFYLIVCSNAWLVKVRDKDCDFAHSYKKDGKELQPVVGYFLAHPTTMKPFFEYKKENGMYKAILKKWVQTNKRGQIKYFDLDDVVHFTLNKQDGMLLGTPTILPVEDDIRTLRKIEEDIQLLMYRDLFPIIHYQVEKPQVLDHTTGLTELEQARNDMQRLVSDGGIATDKRHEINYIGAQGKGVDAQPYLTYFQQRVFTGLGVSPMDMSITGTGNVADGETSSAALIDTVKFLQQELSQQFDQHILMELVLQSPFSEKVDFGTLPHLEFEEVDIEWKIRKENHEADLFNKGVKTIDEVRNPMGMEEFTDEHHGRTFHGLYEKPAQDAEIELAHKQVEVGAAKTIQQIKHKASAARKKAPEKRSAADRDSIKAAKSNSNIVKKKARDSVRLTDAIRSNSLRDEFIKSISKLQDKSRAEKKISTSLALNYVYESIKNSMVDKIYEGMEQAAEDLCLENYDDRICHPIFKPLDSLRDELADAVTKDMSYVTKAANRLVITDRTEQNRAYNYGYALVCVNNKHSKFTICSDFNDIAEDSAEMIGKELDVTQENILAQIPPFRPNSRLKIKVKEIQDGKED